MFTKFKKLTGFKMPKTNEAVLKTLSNEGGFRISLHGAEKMGVSDGDYLTLIQDEEDKSLFAILKVGEDDGGAKLATANKSGVGTLSFSSISAWKNLGGNEETYRVYEIGDAMEIEVSDEETVTIFPLTYLREEPKPVRKKSGEGGESDENDDEEEV